MIFLFFSFAESLTFFSLSADGSQLCRGNTCNPVGPAEQTSSDNDALIYSLVGVGAFIIIVTIISVMICAMKRQEPSSFRKLPFQEEDGFGMVKQWQADYTLSLKR